MSSRKWWVLVVAVLCVFHLCAIGEEDMHQASRLLDAGSTQKAKAVLLARLKQEPLNNSLG